MGMNNPHDAEGSLRDFTHHWMKQSNADPASLHARDNAEYYMDQWFKQMEKRVQAEFKFRGIKITPADLLTVSSVKKVNGKA